MSIITKKYQSFTKRQIATLVLTTAALGFWGWLIYKFGILDVVMYLVINMLMLFPMFLVIFGILDGEVYTHLVETASKVYDETVAAAFSNKKAETEEDSE